MVYELVGVYCAGPASMKSKGCSFTAARANTPCSCDALAIVIGLQIHILSIEFHVASLPEVHALVFMLGQAVHPNIDILYATKSVLDTTGAVGDGFPRITHALRCLDDYQPS